MNYLVPIKRIDINGFLSEEFREHFFPLKGVWSRSIHTENEYEWLMAVQVFSRSSLEYAYIERQATQIISVRQTRTGNRNWQEISGFTDFTSYALFADYHAKFAVWDKMMQ